MLTILTALGGFAASILPDVIGNFFKDRREKADRRHEIQIMNLQVQQQAAGHAQRLEEINVQADIAESQSLHRRVVTVGIPWVDALNSSVRPVITYCFFALFAAQVLGGFFDYTLPPHVWNDNVEALFGGVMGYWFGNRSMKHARERLAR